MNVYKITDKMNPKAPLIPLDPNNVAYIIIHHPDAVSCTWQDINEWHQQQGWNCAGYGEFINKDGDVYILRDLSIGAQCQGYNSTSYGICCEGNYDIETTMPDVQKFALVERIKYNKARFPNLKLIAPHNQFFDTTCPGKYFPLAEILKRVEEKPVEETKIDTNYKNCVDLVVAKCGLNSPEFWLNHQDKNVKALIEKMANYIYTVTDV